MTENYLQAYKKLTISELDSIADYITHSKKSISEAQQQFEKKFEITEDGITIIEIKAEWSGEYSKFHSIFPNFFRFPTFIGLFSYFENQLVKLNDCIQEWKKYKIKYSDLAGNNIVEKNYKYLNHVVGIELDNLNTYWDSIRDMQKIRNCFVHNNSNIITEPTKKLNEQKLFRLINKYPFLTATDYGIMFINNDIFLIDFIKLQKDYFIKLIEKVDPLFRK